MGNIYTLIFIRLDILESMISVFALLKNEYLHGQDHDSQVIQTSIGLCDPFSSSRCCTLHSQNESYKGQVIPKVVPELSDTTLAKEPSLALRPPSKLRTIPTR